MGVVTARLVDGGSHLISPPSSGRKAEYDAKKNLPKPEKFTACESPSKTQTGSVFDERDEEGLALTKETSKALSSEQNPTNLSIRSSFQTQNLTPASSLSLPADLLATDAERRHQKRGEAQCFLNDRQADTLRQTLYDKCLTRAIHEFHASKDGDDIARQLNGIKPSEFLVVYYQLPARARIAKLFLEVARDDW
ncbi:hypothetical protein V8F33_006943 [Rhypophila sp. PSN 637]